MTRRDAHTADLFAVPRPAAPIPASMDYRAQVSHLISAMLTDAHAAGVDRYEVASRASRLAGRDVSKAMLDGYTSEAREEFNVPLWLAPVLETVCSDQRLTEWIAGIRGGRVTFGPDAIDAEIGRLAHEQEQTKALMRDLKALRRKLR